MFPDSEIAAQLVLKRKKCAYIVQTLGDHILKEIVNKLKKHKFSLIIDETTDCSLNKACALIVKYFDKEDKKMTTKLLDLINIYSSSNGSSGESLYNKIIDCFRTLEIPITNLIGFAADGASNVMGSANSVSSRLKQHMPGISIFKCVSHSIHLCSTEAAKTLPRVCEDLVRNVYNSFCHSAKKKFEFKDFQIFCQVKPHKLLHPAATRWLSLHEAVVRILEQWQPLKLYFTQIKLEERLTSVEKIHECLSDPAIFCYLNFLNHVLPLLNRVNLVFQSKGPTLHLLQSHICNLYQSLLRSFCKPSIINNKATLDSIDPSDESIHLPLHQLYVGSEIHTLFQKPEYQRPDMVEQVRLWCKTFYITACLQIIQRFDMNDTLWKLAAHLHPKSVMDPNLRLLVPSLTDLADQVPRISGYDRQTVDDEWREISSFKFPEEVVNSANSIEKFYCYAMDVQDDFRNKRFKCFSQFALEVLSLPTSNADTERMFSKLNLIKRKERNSLNLETVRSLIHLSECTTKSQFHSFTPSKDMIECFK